MATSAEVLLYGNSLFLAGIKAQLEQYPDLAFATINAGCSPFQAHGCRRVILLDFAETSPDTAVNVHRQHPEAVVIALDPLSHSVSVLSHAGSEAASLDDLVQIIRQEPTKDDGARQALHYRGR